MPLGCLQPVHKAVPCCVQPRSFRPAGGQIEMAAEYGLDNTILYFRAHDGSGDGSAFTPLDAMSPANAVNLGRR